MDLNQTTTDRKCANCGRNPGTEAWLGKGSMLEYVHGFYQYWCKLCVARERLKFAKNLQQTIPGLEQKIRELEEEFGR